MDRTLHSSLSRFATRFCDELEKGRNVVCSPLSCEILLALTALGSAGDSHTELLKSMDLPDDDTIRSSFALISSTLKSVEGVTLHLANKVYVTKNGTLKPSVKKDAKEAFGSSLEQLDFMEKAAAADIINRWAAKHTNNKIRDIISPDSLTEDTRLLLINAIYFKGSWETPFEKICTAARAFYVNNTKSIQVPMMSMKDVHFDYKHSVALKAKLLKMPYKGNQSSMVFVVPDEVEGLEEMMRQLASGYDLMMEMESIKRTRVDVMIPRFKVETEIDLRQLLPKMGIETIFDARRSGIQMLTSNDRQFVAQAIQKAVIEVDELGTEAAVSTSAYAREICVRRVMKYSYIANRPFLFVLEASSVPLFLGTYRAVPKPDLSCIRPTYDSDLEHPVTMILAKHFIFKGI